jgi:hypothetical protein
MQLNLALRLYPTQSGTSAPLSDRFGLDTAAVPNWLQLSVLFSLKNNPYLKHNRVAGGF